MEDLNSKESIFNQSSEPNYRFYVLDSAIEFSGDEAKETTGILS